METAAGGEFSGPVPGDGGGMEDNVFMPIKEGREQVGTLAVSPTEYVVDSYTMAALGDGNPEEGAKVMDKTIKQIRQKAYGTREQPKEIYLIGHDINSTNNNVNNLYKGSKHYVAPENGPTPGINWIRQWKTLFDWYPDTKFIKVNRYNDGRDMVNGPITEWTNKNLTYVDYSTLDNLV